MVLINLDLLSPKSVSVTFAPPYREQDLLHSQKLRDLEHAQQEETQLLQERALRLVGRMEEKISALKGG